MSKWMLYVILLLPALLFSITESPEKSTESLLNSMPFEITCPHYSIDLSISVPIINATNKESNIFETGIICRTESNAVSPEEAKRSSFSSDSESAPTYTIQNIATGITCRGFPTCRILTAGDLIHYQIIVTNSAKCSLTNVTLTDLTVSSMSPAESINQDGIMEPNETWTYKGSYMVSQNDINFIRSGSGIIENTATVDCDQFGPISSTATVPIAVLSAHTLNETFTKVYTGGTEKVKKPGDFLTYEAVVTSTGKIESASPVIAGSPIVFFTKDGKITPGIPGQRKSSTSSDICNDSLKDISNHGSSNSISATGIKYGNINPQSSRMNIQNYLIVQPVSPPHNYHYSDKSYFSESGHYVGADGHTITLVNNESAADTTYEQLVEFIKEERTNEIPYSNTSFVCSDAAERVHNNAEAAGFRCAWVYIDFANERATINPATNALVVGHACDLFNTIDRGLVAIDSTGGSYSASITASTNPSIWDNEVSLVKGREYIPKLLYPFPGSNGLKEFSSMGTISDYYIFW